MSNLHLPYTGLMESSGAVTGTTTGTVVSNGSYTQLIASTSFDYNEILILSKLNSGSTDATIDLARGSAGNEQFLIDGLRLSLSATAAQFTSARLPLRVPRGSRIAAQAHGVTPEVIIYGISHGPLSTSGYTRAEALNISSNKGTSIDAGASANTLTAWSQLVASTSRNYNALMIMTGGAGRTAGTAAASWLIDVGLGGAGSEQTLFKQLLAFEFSSTIFGTEPPSYGPFPCSIPSGSRIASRLQCSTSTSGRRALDVAAYGFIR
jgi:hypothetical protein